MQNSDFMKQFKEKLLRGKKLTICDYLNFYYCQDLVIKSCRFTLGDIVRKYPDYKRPANQPIAQVFNCDQNNMFLFLNLFNNRSAYRLI